MQRVERVEGVAGRVQNVEVVWGPMETEGTMKNWNV